MDAQTLSMLKLLFVALLAYLTLRKTKIIQ